MNIDKEALEMTKNQCHLELDIVCNKYHLHLFPMIMNYLIKDLKNHVMWACIGLILVFVVSLLMKEITTFCTSLYFLFLGFMALFEQMKNHIYHIDELLETCYLGSGKRFLYKTLSISLLQILYFIIICLILPIGKYQVIEFMLFALLPIYIAQIISLAFIHYISHIISCVVVYVITYMIVLFVVKYFNFVDTMSFLQCLLMIVCVVLMNCVQVFCCYRRKERLSWNLF